MKKVILLSILLPLVCSPELRASSVTFGAVPQARSVNDASATLLTNTNSLVWAGTFANESFTLNSSQSLAANLASITSSGGWEQFGLDTSTGLLNSGVISTLGVNATGKITGGVADNNFGATKADFFNNKNLYLWVFNATTVGAATQMGIFRSTDATTPWTFPVNAGGVGDTPTYSTAPAAAPTMVAIGGFGSTTSSTLQLAGNFDAVPEPSRWFLMMMGTVLVFLRRRR